MDQNQARGVVNELLYPIDGIPVLSDAVVNRLVENVIEGRFFITAATDFAAAIEQTLRAGKLDPQTSGAYRRHTEDDLLMFLRQVERQLSGRLGEVGLGGAVSPLSCARRC